MAFDAAAVAEHLNETSPTPERLAAIDLWVDAVTAYASRRWTTPEDPDDLVQFEQAMVMQTARLVARKKSINGMEGVGADNQPVVVHRFDGDVRDLLSDFLIVAGIFGRPADS